MLEIQIGKAITVGKRYLTSKSEKEVGNGVTMGFLDGFIHFGSHFTGI